VHEQETYGLLGRLNWDLAMLVELAKKDEDAMEALAKALAVIRERWKPETTARNVRTVSEVIRKGKSGKSNEFGKVVKLEEAENQIIRI
jgi:3-methyladenine DNA glycosylase Tag